MLKDNIKKARLEAGLTQLEVAEKLGVAQAQYALSLIHIFWYQRHGAVLQIQGGTVSHLSLIHI